jgi:hypothetical protein
MSGMPPFVRGGGSVMALAVSVASAGPAATAAPDIISILNFGFVTLLILISKILHRRASDASKQEY